MSNWHELRVTNIGGAPANETMLINLDMVEHIERMSDPMKTLIVFGPHRMITVQGTFDEIKARATALERAL